jgi:putative Ca2+/H+ antiporter (TMEM165/GDT1 family)
VDLSVVASAFALLFLAELGDKTQLMTITLASRYRPLPVAIGVCAAFLVLNLLAVLLGELLFRYVPLRAVLVASALLFLLFGWNSWRAAGREEPAEEGATGMRGALLGSFVLIFVAELGDKTQLALLALAASTGAPWSVFVGGTLALWSVSLLGVFLGATLLARVPRHWLHRAAAVLFALFGVLALARAVLA